MSAVSLTGCGTHKIRLSTLKILESAMKMGLDKLFAFFSSGKLQKDAAVPPASNAEGEKEIFAKADRLIDAGNAAEDLRNFAEAQHCYEQALLVAPQYWRVYLNMGGLCDATGRGDLALKHYRTAHAANARHFATCYNLGLGLGRIGQVGDAIRLLQDAIALKPDFVDAMVLLCDSLEKAGRHAESLPWYERALTLQPGHTGILSNKALCLEALEQTDEAWGIFEQILVQNPGDGRAMQNLANLARKAGDIEQALEFYRRLLPLNSGREDMDAYLMCLGFSDTVSPEHFFAEHRRYQAYFDDCKPVALFVGAANQPAPQRIGFISPDFCAHAVAYFIEPLLRHLDRQRFKVFAYSATPTQDAVTARLKTVCDVWREVVGLDASVVAQQIAEDKIDILIDLTGHTAYNRLDVLALRPAPVTATWLGYLGTTGMDAVDYRIVDTHTDPAGMTEAFHCERLIRLPHSQWCYQPQPDTPDVAALPAQTNRYVTFGSFNQAPKLSPTILKLWASLLLQVENSRLLLMAVPVGRGRERILKVFRECGVDPARITFRGRTPWNEYFASYGSVDIALDSFPYTGGTTTCDALYMGVPVLTLAGRHSVARSGVSLLTNVGLADWVAADADEFLRIGLRVASDIDGLAEFRAGLRARFLASPLGDQQGFARDFAAALDAMWHDKFSAS
jgi:protein O-GlcNAc transferase